MLKLIHQAHFIMKYIKLISLILGLFVCSLQSTYSQCSLPAGFLGQDTIVCDSICLGPIAGLQSYSWNSSATDTFSTFLAQQGGLYWLEALDNMGNVCRDTIAVIVNPSPIVVMGPPLHYCAKRSINLCGGLGSPWGGWGGTANYSVFDSLSMSFVPLPPQACYFFIDSTTTFEIEVIAPNTCSTRDTFVVFFNESMTIQLDIYPDFGENDGAVKANIIGGHAPFTYDWGVPAWQNQDSISNLSQGFSQTLEVEDSTGCIAMVNFTIPYEIGVFPGDCDHSQRVEMSDIFPIGQFFGEMGPTRPQASLDWKGQVAPLWQRQQTNGKDLRHVDSDGDGLISWSDTTAIQINFDSTHLNQRPVHAGEGLPLYFDMPNKPIWPGDTVLLPIMIGKADTLAFSLLGLAFDIGIDLNHIEANSANLSFDTCWLGTVNQDLIQLDRSNASKTKFSIGMVKNDGQAKSGYGQIGTLQFVLKHSAFSPISIPLTYAKAIDNIGAEMDINPQNGNLVLSPIISIRDDFDAFFSLFPNPTSSEIHLSHPGIQILEIKLYSSQGQVVEVKRQLGLTKSTLNLSGLAEGLYWLEVKSKEGLFHQQVVLR